jgi:hypothetical protein
MFFCYSLLYVVHPLTSSLSCYCFPLSLFAYSFPSCLLFICCILFFCFSFVSRLFSFSCFYLFLSSFLSSFDFFLYPYLFLPSPFPMSLLFLPFPLLFICISSLIGVCYFLSFILLRFFFLYFFFFIYFSFL